MKMHWRRFLVFNAAGGILWAIVVGVGFYYFASVLKALRAPLDIAIGVAAALALVGGLVLLRRKEKELGAAAERAYPGPPD
jgi:membrane protein DedA with SNARE-associated domain